MLRYVAASDVAGRLIMSVEQFERTSLEGTTIKNQVDLNEFIEKASPEKRAALGRELGIAEGEWDTLKLSRFNEAVRAYRESGKLEARRAEIKAVEQNKNAYTGEAVGEGNIRYTYEGKAADGKSIYKSNFPKGTPKKAKSERILKYITDVWSKKPISLVISNGETSRTIKAEFDPTIDETENTPTDASKLAGGNRHGTHSEQRVTLDLADDYHQIVEESKYNYSKEETGKDNPAHEGVKLWHYFVDDIYFIEQENSDPVPYRVTINVKEKDNGDFVYSFNAEKTEESSTRQTLHAGVNTRKGANGELFIDSITDSAKKSNSFEQNSQENAENSADFGKNAASAESSPEKMEKDTPSTVKDGPPPSKMEAEKSSKEKIAEAKERIDKKKIDAYLRENVEDYAGLSAANQSMIRQIVREGRVHGLDEADILSYARVAAHTGLNVTFDVTSEKVRVNSEEVSDIAGYFDPDNNRIVVNPKTTKKQELILIHELDHAIRAFVGFDGKIHYLVYKDADKKISQETRDMIKKEYSNQDVEVSIDELLADEASAYYTEAILGGKATVDLLLGKEPSLAKKILNFFTGAARAYSKDAKLSKEARRHYKRFKAMFDAFADRNKGRNAMTAGAAIDNGKLTVEIGESVRYSLAINAETEIDDVLKNKFHKDFVKLTDNTPSILLAQKGVRNLPLHMKPTHVRENILTKKEALSKGYRVDKHTHYHGLGKTLFLKIISDLDNVREAYRGTKNAEKAERRENYFLLVSTIKDAEGNTINVPIYINEHADYHNVVVDTNKVATVFGRIGLREYINNEIRNGNLVKIKNRSPQVGDAAALIAAPYDMNASNTSISQSAEKSTDSAKKVSENSAEGGKSIRKSKDITPKAAEESGIEKSIGKLGEGKVESVAGRDAKARAAIGEEQSKLSPHRLVGRDFFMGE